MKGDVQSGEGRAAAKLQQRTNTTVVSLDPGVILYNVVGRQPQQQRGSFLVAAIVESHAGSISVDRAPLGGARFRVRIPLADQGSSARHP